MSEEYLELERKARPLLIKELDENHDWYVVALILPWLKQTREAMKAEATS